MAPVLRASTGANSDHSVESIPPPASRRIVGLPPFIIWKLIRFSPTLTKVSTACISSSASGYKAKTDDVPSANNDMKKAAAGYALVFRRRRRCAIPY
ncbi:MAG: hypothetical protein OEY18_14450 [Candidatus Aminicenantes bacterium]|nr:hypothetical protein [Candidatus Aminicenantes bacterium]